MVEFIFKNDKRYMVFSADAFGVSASHSSLLEDIRNYPYIPLTNHKGIKICANRRSLALLYLRDILESMEKISFDTLRDFAVPKLKERLDKIGQVVKGYRFLEELYIIFDNIIYKLSRSGAIVGINSNYACSAAGIENGLSCYIDRHINDDIKAIVTGMDNLIGEMNDIRRPPYFIVDLDNDNIERICL